MKPQLGLVTIHFAVISIKTACVYDYSPFHEYANFHQGCLDEGNSVISYIHEKLNIYLEE